MMRGTRGFCIGCGGVLLSVLSVGCAQSQNGRNRQTTSSAQPRQANVVTAAADVVNTAAGVATGAVTGAVNGAVAGATSGAQTTTRQRAPRIKRNGRGGYDASELQQDALRRAHAMADRYGTIDRTRATTQPTTRPANR